MKQQRKLISLVGMTGCGKTSVGKILANRIGADIIDIDDEIVKRYGSIRAIFDERGDEGFREVEYETLQNIINSVSIGRSESSGRNVSSDKNVSSDMNVSSDKNVSSGRITIISCGGGLPTYEKSARLIAERTLVVWLRRSPDSIPDDSEVLLRPPVNGSRENYKKLLDARCPIYRRVSDYSFYNSFPKRTAREIAKRLGFACKLNPKNKRKSSKTN